LFTFNDLGIDILKFDSINKIISIFYFGNIHNEFLFFNLFHVRVLE